MPAPGRLAVLAAVAASALDRCCSNDALLVRFLDRGGVDGAQVAAYFFGRRAGLPTGELGAHRRCPESWQQRRTGHLLAGRPSALALPRASAFVKLPLADRSGVVLVGRHVSLLHGYSSPELGQKTTRPPYRASSCTAAVGTV